MSRITKQLKKKLKTTVLFLSVAVVLSIVTSLAIMVQPTNSRDNKDPSKQREMMRIILDCGELAPIPKGANIQTIKTEGNMFTRSFRLVFEADVKTIDNWLNNSKGIKAAKIINASNTRKYILNTKCGFQYAEVKIDQHNIVTIYLSKS